jgi:hypothetical protein
MNSVQSLRALAAFAAALTLVAPRNAAAVQLDTVVSNIHQIGISAGVSLGHTAIGYTNFNRITVSGAYTTACASAQLVPTTGQRTLSREEIIGGFGLVTTIPERVPATVNIPGFESLPLGSSVACTYNWTAKAVESSYSLGIPGFGMQSGSGEQAAGGTYPFMLVTPAPDRRAGDDGCV